MHPQIFFFENKHVDVHRGVHGRDHGRHASISTSVGSVPPSVDGFQIVACCAFCQRNSLARVREPVERAPHSHGKFRVRCIQPSLALFPSLSHTTCITHRLYTNRFRSMNGGPTFLLPLTKWQPGFNESGETDSPSSSWCFFPLVRKTRLRRIGEACTCWST